MGWFSVTTVMRNRENLSREKFTELFCEKMQEMGYVATDRENSEFFRAVAFTEKWITLVSDSTDMAKRLDMDCIRVEEVDSDFITMDVYSSTGRKAESILIGEPYWEREENEQMGYFNPTEKVWSVFLENGYSWEQFTEAFSDDNTTEITKMIGMNISHIFLSEKDIEEDCECGFVKDDNIFFLYFRKA
ncbi:MAG: hypothetical protein K2J08_00510 [Ruminococcus sp.]|nr:hypothetical protein [Ruminococcus sp.]